MDPKNVQEWNKRPELNPGQIPFARGHYQSDFDELETMNAEELRKRLDDDMPVTDKYFNALRSERDARLRERDTGEKKAREFKEHALTMVADTRNAYGASYAGGVILAAMSAARNKSND